MFVDEVKVYARAGHGGRGCVAFLRETFRPKGGPSGGNGGRGGNVVLRADHDLNNLIHQFYTPRLIAPNGQQGGGKGMDGLAGEDLIIKVPCGTLVWKIRDTTPPPELPSKKDQESSSSEKSRPLIQTGKGGHAVIRHSGGERALEINLEDDAPQTEAYSGDKGELVADLTQHGQEFILCKAGRGGLGNRNFATARRQTPRFAQPGEPGQEGEYLFELRLMAEVGLVGYPNAGKSTLLTAISKARPKIAPYPFTTLHPQIGIVEYEDFFRLTVCDVPGLIEGAHHNAGLGHAFLRHIQRCKVLAFVIDMAGTDGRAPWDDYKQLLVELELFDPALVAKPRLIIANKMDETAAVENLPKFKRRIKKVTVIPISAAFDDGIDKFKSAIRKAVSAASQSE